MLLGARVLTVEVGTSKYEMGGGKMGGWARDIAMNSLFLKCVCVCAYMRAHTLNTYIMCEYVYVHG